MIQSAIGTSLRELDTPALLLDLDASDQNIERMATFFADRTAQLRPHFKNHKCTKLAQRQLAAGSAVGMTCANITEAEALCRIGVSNILIANQIVGQAKLQRLVRLAEQCEIAVAVDDLAQAQSISAAATTRNVTIHLLMEVDIGMGRCGVAPHQSTLDLVNQIVDLPGTSFGGLQAYEGQCVFVDDFAARSLQATQSMMLAIETRDRLEQGGVKVDALSGCSSSTYKITGVLDGVDEVQAGTYATMDWRYHQLVPEFEIALSLLATVISYRADRAVLDVGAKTIGAEFGSPQIKGEPDIEIPFFGAEEHPSHACTTCNLHPQLYVHQNGQVVDIWPIDGRETFVGVPQ